MMKNKFNEEPRAFDIFGNIASAKFPKGFKSKDKKKFADKIMKSNKAVRTVLEKTRGFQGRLRKQQTNWIAGEKTKEALYHENGCVFRLNIDKVYFSPRLSNERKEIASLIKRGDVLVMFAGVGPYSIVIAKNSKAEKVFSNEINREANRYAQLNIELNNLKGKVILVPGDIKRIAKKLEIFSSYSKKNPERGVWKPFKFDVIVMPRPQLKESFLKEAFTLSKKGTRIFYYDFCKADEINLIRDKIKSEAKKYKKRIKILKVKKTGEIAPYKFRVRVDFMIL